MLAKVEQGWPTAKPIKNVIAIQQAVLKPNKTLKNELIKRNGSPWMKRHMLHEFPMFDMGSYKPNFGPPQKWVGLCKYQASRWAFGFFALVLHLLRSLPQLNWNDSVIHIELPYTGCCGFKRLRCRQPDTVVCIYIYTRIFGPRFARPQF